MPLLALVVLLAFATSAQADIRLQPVRSFDAQEGTVIPRDRIVSFDDVGDCAPGEFTIQINWGDGTTSPGEITFTDALIGVDLQTIRCTYEASGGHTYRTAASAPLSVSVCRGAECQTRNGGNANVGEAPIAGELDGFSARAGRPYTGRVARFRDENSLAQASDYTAVVDWGDGTTSPGTVSGDDGRFEVESGHTYGTAGARAMRVTLLQNGAERVVVAGTIDVRAEDGSAATPAGNADPGRIVANSARGTARTSLRLRSRTLSAEALRRGLPVTITAPSSLRTLRVAVVTTTGRGRTIGVVTVRLRGGKVSGGVRTLSTRVRLSTALRGKLRRGSSYALQARTGATGLESVAQFRVR